MNLLNVNSVSDVRQVKMYAAEPIVPDPNLFEVEIYIVKLKNINLPVVIKFQQN
jgi:hypothetical protein